MPSHRHPPMSVDKHLTVYVLLAGVVGGVMLAVLVMVCCKICLKKKKTRYLKDPDEFLESGLSQSWTQTLPDSGPEDFSAEIELQELTRTSNKETAERIPKADSSSPERPPDPTSVVRRRSSVGIQRQASVCLSDEEEQMLDGPNTEQPKEVTQIAAIVHRSCNDNREATSGSQLYPPFIHSHSSPDSGTTDNISQHGHSTNSLHNISNAPLARVVDLEDYHYSRQQVWELVTQGTTLLKDKSQSDMDMTAEPEASDPSYIQQAPSTEAGLLEKSLEHHQLEHLQIKKYSPFEEENARSKVRYNDTGSREDIREEVIEMISGESSDDSNSSVENELLKQQSRQLWELRAILEEEEDKLSDTQEAEDDPLVSCDLPDILSTHATSMESNTVVSCDDPGYECDESDYLQLPSHELRRHCYKSLLNKRFQQKTPRTESSFDSWDSSSTDRTDGASFESTTDNTDSTGEGQTNRLQQMKADSGYKSMESNGKAPRLCRKQLQFTLEGDSIDQILTTMEGTFDDEVNVLLQNRRVTDTIKTRSSIETSKAVSFEGVMVEGEDPPPNETHVLKKKYKSALKKHCTDTQWSDPLSEMTGRDTVFQRFFRSGRMDQLQKFRDYSIDEKSDALFREFSRPTSRHLASTESPPKKSLPPQDSRNEEASTPNQIAVIPPEGQ